MDIGIERDGLDQEELLLDVKGVKLRDRILLSPYTKFVLPTCLMAIIVPVSIYAGVFQTSGSDTDFSIATCHILESYYVNCLPGKNTTEATCLELGCCWNSTSNFCYHSIPSAHGYTPVGGSYYTGVSLTPRRTHSPLGSANVENLYLDITTVDSNHIKVTLQTTETTSRRRRENRASRSLSNRRTTMVEDHEDEVGQSLPKPSPRYSKRSAVEIDLVEDSNLVAYAYYPEFSVSVARVNSANNDTTALLSTARGPLIMTDSYWEWTLYLTNSSVYGLNDLELNGTTNWVYNNENGTVTTAFLGISTDGEGAAYYIDYSGPLEAQVLNGSNLVILRGLALPETISVHVFAGPTPLEAVQQLYAAFANTTAPPIETYGLHVCPNGEFDSLEDAITDLNTTIDTMEFVMAPWDSHCIHERLCPVLPRSPNTTDLESIAEIQETLANTSRYFIPHLSPMVLADNGSLHETLENSSLLLTTNSSDAYVGVYQDEDVVFPDWTSPDTSTIVLDYFTEYLENLGVSTFLWLRGTWPKDELGMNFNATLMGFDYMPETLESLMSNSTIPFNLSSTSVTSHHARHNTYPDGFRNFVRSSVPAMEFLGPPGEAGNTSWSSLRRAVRAGVGAGLVGQLPPTIYLCGTAGYNASLHEELCIRWYGVAVAWPHVVVLPERSPGGSSISSSASLTMARALRLRASLATYQHTTVAKHIRYGTPVLAPTSLHYPAESKFRHTWDQFMWGDGILVGLVTLPLTHQIAMWIPGDLAWKHLEGGSEVEPSINGTIVVTAALSQIVTLLRPGYLIPIHKEVSMTTVETMLSNVTLVGNLACDVECLAFGEIYYGSGTGAFLTVGASNTTLTLENILNVKNYACVSPQIQSTVIEKLELLGNSTHEINIDLCSLEVDTIEISFT